MPEVALRLVGDNVSARHCLGEQRSVAERTMQLLHDVPQTCVGVVNAVEPRAHMFFEAL